MELAIALTVLAVVVLGWTARAVRVKGVAEAASRESKRQGLALRSAEAEAEESRKRLLRERDYLVDRILSELCAAKDDLERVLARLSAWPTEAEDVQAVHDWKQRHEAVADFTLFKQILEEHVWSEEGEPFVEAEEILEVLRTEFDGRAALDYADAQLGLDRKWRLVDGPHYGGFEFERPDGEYANADLRLEKVCVEVKAPEGGYLYALTNPSLPGMVKIGSTRRSPDARAEELSRHSGVPTPFVVKYSVSVSDCSAIELAVHRRLAAYRVSERREFFRIDVAQAVQVLEEIAQSQW
jgi:hypothetical protein